MKQKLLTLMMSVMCILGMSAQDLIEWEDPIGQYQTETVVYATVLVNNQPTSGMFVPATMNEGDCQIGAFVNGTLRAVVDMYNYTNVAMPTALQEKVQPAEYAEDGSPLIAVYTFRVGGDDAADADAKIEFRVLSGGAVYKAHTYLQGVIGSLEAIEINRRELANVGSDELVMGEFTGLNWKGDATINNPTNFYCINFAPAMMVTSTPEIVALEMRIGDPAINLKEQFESFKFSSGDGTEVAGPIEGGFWEYDSQYLSFEGDNVTAIAKPETEYPLSATYRHGMFINPEGCTAEITILDPWVYVEDIMVNDVTLYKGQSTVPEVIFNNGESTPTETGYTMVANNTEVVEVLNGIGLNALEIGETTVTVTSVGTNSDGNTVSYDFAVNVLSALDKFGFYVADEFVSETTLEVWRYEEEIDLANMLPYAESTPVEDWSGDLPFGFTDFTITSNAPEVVSVEMDQSGMQVVKALKKGVATLTYTNSYDPSKTATVVVTVKQAPTSIEFVSYSIDGGDEIFFANLPAAMIEAGLGQAITVNARIVPEDADINEGTFTMECMRADGLVEILTPSKAEGNQCSISFKGIATGNFLLHAQAEFGEGVEVSKSLNVSIKESVTDIEVAEETTLWIHSNGQTFDFPITVLPETATVKDLNFTYESLDEGVSFLTSPISLDLTDTGYMLTVNSKGNVKVTATSVDNPAVSKTFNVYIKRQVDGIVFETDGETSNINMYNDGQEYNVYVRILPADADFIEDEFSLVAEYSNDNFGGESGWEAFSSYILEIVQNPETPNAGGEYYYNYRITGKALCPEGFILTASYSGETQGMPVEKIAGIDVTVNEKIEIPIGWSWISLTSGAYTPQVPGLIEARSQSQLVYNDPSYGYFGDFDMMNPNAEAYKLNMEAIYSMYPIYSADNSAFISGAAPSLNLRKGWNWIGYPYEYSYMASEVFDVSQFAEGDIILSKESGLAALKNGVWENDFALNPNEGYMLYHNGEATTAALPGRFTMAQGDFVAALSQDAGTYTTKAMSLGREASVWNFDGSRFANTMAIIGQLEMNDDASDYTIGAFVGDECRGEGKVVNGTAYITAVGEVGETVSFRLYNKWNGQYSDVTTKLAFGDIAGSVKSPVTLSAPVVTGIDDVEMGNQGIYFNGNTLNLGDYNGTATIMTVDGKVAATTTAATISLDELPAGVYVVIVNSEEGRIVKKIAKN